jgi:hypothetical protein
MAKKIEVDIDYLKSIGLSQMQILNIIKKSEPEHWTNKLSFGSDCFTLREQILISPSSKLMMPEEDVMNLEPVMSFRNQEDAIFIMDKCRLLIEMSNFSFAVNDDWCPDWNNKEEKKYGVVLQNGQARVSENELFNLYVFGIVTRSRSLALEMLEEFKERIETYFNKPFNSINEEINLTNILHPKDYAELYTNGTIGSAIDLGKFGTTTGTQVDVTETIHNTITDTNFSGSWKSKNKDDNLSGSFAPRYESVSTRKKRKVLIESDIPKIQELLLNDIQQKDIAEKFGYSEATISQLKRKLGFKMCRSRIDE